MGPENDKYYVKSNRDLDAYYTGKDEKVIFIKSSDEEIEQRKQRKRKSTTNMDEINKIPKKQIRAKRVIYPTGALFALKEKSKLNQNKRKKTKTKVKIEGDLPSIVPGKKNRKRKKKINGNKIIFVKPTIKRKGLIDFNKFIRANVIEPGQRRSFDFKACNVKQEIIDSYQK